MDLIALNIQRGRDHGLRGYNDYRQECQVGRASSFSDLRNTMSGEAIAKLRSVYNSVDDIDLYAGMIMETPEYQGSYVGRTFLCLIGDTFARIKKGDRFFYDLGGQVGSFTESQGFFQTFTLCLRSFVRWGGVSPIVYIIWKDPRTRFSDNAQLY